MRKLSKIVLYAMILGGIVLFSGCEGIEDKQTKEMFAHMYEKYGVEFQIDWESRTVTGSYDSYNLSLKGNTDEEQKGLVQVEYWFDTDNLWRDNYFVILTQPVVQERIENVINDAFPYKMKISPRSYSVDNKYRSVEQFDEYVKERGDNISGHSIRIFVQDQGSEAENIRFEKEVKELLRKANIGNPFLLFVCFKEDDFVEIDTDVFINNYRDVYTYRTNKNLYDE